MTGVILGLTILAACPAARDARWAGDADTAIRAAHACLNRAPDDVESQLELSRALALDGQLDEARTWADRALATAPAAPDPRVWRARLAYWDGDLETARATLTPVLETLDAPEAWALAGRVEMARGDARRAEVLFTTALTLAPTVEARLGRAHARSRLGRGAEAFSDLDAACRQDDCRDQWRWWRNSAPVAVHAESEVLVGTRGDGTQVDSTVHGTLAAPWGLRIGPIASMRARTDTEADAAVGAIASQNIGANLRLDVELQAGLLRETLPLWDVRGTFVISRLGPLWLELTGRYLDFVDDGAAIAEPTVCGDAGRWGGCARYSAVFPEQGPETVRHFGLLQGWIGLSRALTFRWGAGGGNTNDFMIAREQSAAWSAVGYGGLEWFFSRQHGVSATYTFRHEDQNQAEALDLHQLGFAYDLRLGW